jgi:hypothetical protein
MHAGGCQALAVRMTVTAALASVPLMIIVVFVIIVMLIVVMRTAVSHVLLLH